MIIRAIVFKIFLITFANAHAPPLTDSEKYLMEHICTNYPGCTYSRSRIDHQKFQINCPKQSSTPVIKIHMPLHTQFSMYHEIILTCNHPEIDVHLSSVLKSFGEFAHSFYQSNEHYHFEIKNCKLSEQNVIWTMKNNTRVDKINYLSLTNVKNININAVNDIHIPIDTLEINHSDLNKRLNILNSIPDLTSLRLDDNNLTSLDGLKLRKLERLSSLHNKIKNISRETFTNLKAIQIIYLEGTEIESLDQDTFSDVNEMFGVTIESDRISKLNNNSFNLQNLHMSSEIKIVNSNKSMNELTEGVFMNDNIKVIEINCGLRKISSASFGILPELIHLSLSDNYLTELPSDFSLKFPKLNHLNLSNNLLLDLPDNLMRTNFLVLTISLDLSYNKLTHWRR